MKRLIIGIMIGFMLSTGASGAITAKINKIAYEKKAEKQKHVGKAWKNISLSDKDRILFILAKAEGLVPAETPF